MTYLVHILILVEIYVVLAVSLDLLVGEAGLLPVCHGALYGVGAYVTAVALLRYGGQFFFPALLFTAAFGAAAGGVLAKTVLRTAHEHFVLVTLAAQMAAVSVLRNIDVTGGTSGLRGIPRPVIAAWSVDTPPEYLILTTSLALGGWSLRQYVRRAALGLALNALRDNTAHAEAVGIDTQSVRALVFAISAGVAATAGAVYASYTTYIDPSSFGLTESILIFAMVALGGPASRFGPVIGAGILIILPELLRLVGIAEAATAHVRQVLFGLILLVVMVYAPPKLTRANRDDALLY